MHLNNPSLSQVGLAALCNITIKRESNEVSRISKDELQVLHQVMLKHQNTQLVQSIAIQLLQNFTFSQSNLEVLGNDKHIIDTVLAARSVHREGFEGRDEELLMSLPTWQQTASTRNSNRTSFLDDLDDRVRSKVEMDSSLGKSLSNSSRPSSAVAIKSRPSVVAIPSCEGTPLDRHIQKMRVENALRASDNSENSFLEDLDDRVRSKIDMDGSLGKSRSNSSLPSSAAATKSRLGAVAIPSCEGTPLDRHIQKMRVENALRASDNNEDGSGDSHSGASYSMEESRPCAAIVTSGDTLLDKRMKKKNGEQASMSQLCSQGNASESLPQGNRLLDERVARKLDIENARSGVSQPSAQTTTPSANLVLNNSKLDIRVRAKQRKGLLGKIRVR